MNEKYNDSSRGGRGVGLYLLGLISGILTALLSFFTFSGFFISALSSVGPTLSVILPGIVFGTFLCGYFLLSKTLSREKSLGAIFYRPILFICLVACVYALVVLVVAFSISSGPRSLVAVIGMSIVGSYLVAIIVRNLGLSIKGRVLPRALIIGIVCALPPTIAFLRAPFNNVFEADELSFFISMILWQTLMFPLFARAIATPPSSRAKETASKEENMAMGEWWKEV